MADTIKRYAPVAAVLVLYIVGCWNQALFFAPYQTYVLVAFMAVMAGLTILAQGWKPSLPWWLVPATGYVVYLALTTLWSPAKVLAVGGVVVLVSSWLVAWYFSSTEHSIRYQFVAGVTGLAAVLYLFGMGAVLKWWYYNGAYEVAPGGTNMLNSIFQYHNTFGAFELMGLVMAIGLLVTAKAKWSRMAYTLVGSLSLIGVVLSYSRWVWLLLPLLIVMYLAVQLHQRKLGRAVSSVAYVLLVGFISLPFAIPALSKGSSKDFVISLLLSIVFSVGVGYLYSPIANLVARSKNVRYIIVGIGTLLLLAGAYLVIKHESSKLGELIGRAQSIGINDFSVRQRLLFYRAGLKMWLDNPVFGSGWGTWTAKFQAYEQYPYWATRIHSIFMNNLINGGLIGMVLWLSMLIVAVSMFFRSLKARSEANQLQIIGAVGAAALLLHGLFDFDFSFPLVSITFFGLLAIASPKDYSTKSASPALTGARLAYVPLTVIVFIAGGLLSVEQLLYTRAQALAGDAQVEAMKQAEAWAPYDPLPYLSVAQAEISAYAANQNQANAQMAMAQIKTAAENAPWDPGVQMTAASIAYKVGNLEGGYQYAKRSYLNGPFHDQYPETYMGIALWTSIIGYSQDATTAKSRLQDIVQTFNKVQSEVAAEQHMPYGLHQEWPFTVTDAMKAYAATAQYTLGDFKGSLATLGDMPATGTDPGAVSLGKLVLVLDSEQLHLKTSPVLKGEILSDKTLSTEFQYLTKIQPIAK